MKTMDQKSQAHSSSSYSISNKLKESIKFSRFLVQSQPPNENQNVKTTS